MQQKRILITGGAGSLGSRLVKRLLKDTNPKEIRILSRHESSQVALKYILNNPLVAFFIGDIRDKTVVKDVTYGIDIIIHLAALKHVPICEENVFEAVQTNVIGTENLIEAALEENVEKMIFISTDKASKPDNIYGYTKSLSERLIDNAVRRKGNKRTLFASCRFGNMIGSEGSVLPIFKKQIKEKSELTLTDPEMTRFVITIGQAIDIILFSLCNMLGVGEIIVPVMNSLRLKDLADVLIELSGKDVKINIIGPRPGEKIVEHVISLEESARSFYMNSDFYAILPANCKNKISIPATFVACKNAEVNSISVPILTNNSIKKLLERVEYEEMIFNSRD